MAYIPPTANPTELFFEPPVGYTAPTANPSELFFNDAPPNTILAATAGDTSSFGTAFVEFAVRTISPTGIGSTTAFGTASISNNARVLYPDGIAPIGFGATFVRDQYEYIRPRGFEFEQTSRPFVTRDGQYVPQRPHPIVLDFGYGSLEHYPGGSTILEFAPPNATPTIRYTSLGVQTKFGTAAISKPPALYPSSINELTFGTATIYNTSEVVYPTGFSSHAHGVAVVVNRNAYLLAAGIAPNPLTGTNSLREVPSPTIDLRTKYALPGGIAPPVSAFGTHYVAFYYQFIDQAGTGSGPETFGTAFIAYRYRYVYPTFIVSEAHGATKVSRKIFVYPSGFGGETFPTTHTIEPRVDRIYPNTGSTEQAGYGIANLRNQRDFLYVTNNYWVAEQFSTPKVYNQTQELFVGQYENTSADPAGYGAHAVENRNRTVTTFGHQDSRFSFYAADVNNSARAILPLGFTTEWGDTLVAYRIRNVYPTGTDTSYLSPSAIVYNNARLLAPTGFRSDTVGVAIVVNRNRTVSQYFPYGGESVGTAFIAYRIRYLGVFSLNDVPAAYPEVRFNPAPIAPVGIDSYRTGGHDVIEHFSIVYPRSTNVPVNPAIGEPYIQNRNKEIGPYAYEQTTFGVHSIQNYIRYVYPTLGDTATYGLAYVADSRRSVGPTPFSSHAVSTFTQIRNVIPDPPGQQNVVVYAGIPPSNTQVGSPTMSYLTLFPTAINESRIGAHVVRTNNIFPPSLPYDDYVGTPSLIAARYLYAKQIPFPASPGQGESDVFTSKPRVSPHTIYAPSSDQATGQAISNHGGVVGHIIDAGVVHFGTHRIESKNRTIYPIWNQFDLAALKTKWGSPFVDLKTRRVYPIAIRSFRAGNLSTNASQEVMDTSVGVATLFGVATLYDPAYIPTIAPSGIAPLVISNIDITLLNRQVYPTGFDDNAIVPTRWGVPLMGYTRRPEFQGYVATLWGVPRVEYRNRFVHPVGTDMFHSANELPGFNQRMRVRHAPQVLQAVGFQATRLGDTNVTI